MTAKARLSVPHRRAAFLQSLYPKLVAVPIRGNADRRLEKLDGRELGVDAMFTAPGCDAWAWPTGQRDPRPVGVALRRGCRGVVIEHRTDHGDTAGLLSTVTHPSARGALDAERAVPRSKADVSPAPQPTPFSSRHPTRDGPRRRPRPFRPARPRTASSGPADRAEEVGRDAGLGLLHAGAARLLAVSPTDRLPPSEASVLKAQMSTLGTIPP